MGFFKSTKGSIISDYFELVESHANLQAGLMYDVALYDDHLTIKSGKDEATLKYSQITDVVYSCELETIAVNKSPIGRALAGGLLFGGVGAVVGAVSGTGTKNKKEVHFYFIISYTSSAGEDKFIAFEDTRLYKGVKLSKKLKELCNIENKPNSVEL